MRHAAQEIPHGREGGSQSQNRLSDMQVRNLQPPQETSTGLTSPQNQTQKVRREDAILLPLQVNRAKMRI
jgi:hypothetical protein